ncbi:MAG: type III-B CRISPR module-associated protein Cmr5 [Candidatus Asgardarchaeia archaeon]
MSELRTLEQERARYALNYVETIERDEKKEVQEKFSSYVRSASPLILTNGLANTLAFYWSKIKVDPREVKKREDLNTEENGKKKRASDDQVAYWYLYRCINEWLSNQNLIDEVNGKKDVLTWILLKASSIDVFRITQEVLRLLQWVKRFADAKLKKEGVSE